METRKARITAAISISVECLRSNHQRRKAMKAKKQHNGDAEGKHSASQARMKANGTSFCDDVSFSSFPEEKQ